MRNDVLKTFKVAILLCVVCSALVSYAAVTLRPTQVKNAELDKKKNILEAAGMYSPDADIEETFSKIEAVAINFETGEIANDIDPATYNQREAASNPETNVEIPRSDDKAGIKTRAKYGIVYLIKEDGKIKQLILPIHGKGLWSTLYGFLALANDTTTVKGLTFYEHAETPGLGGEVDNPNWKAKWPGKQIYDQEGQRRIEVVKGQVDASGDDAKYKVDGLSGATITTRGVSGTLAYWMGENGYKPFLEHVRKGEI